MTLKPGQEVPTSVVGTGVTNASGAFKIAYNNAARVRADADLHGNTNLDVESTSDGSPSFFNVTLAAPSATTNHVAAATADSDAVSTVVALHPVPGAVEMSADSVKTPDQGGCTFAWVHKSSYGAEQVQIGEGYTRTGATGTFTYKSGSSSDLGVGVSASGTKGSFSASGTASVSSDASETETPVSGDNGVKWRSEFEYGKYAYECVETGDVSSYESKVRGFAGGASYIASTAPSSTTYCVGQSANSSFTKSDTAAYTFGTGVDTTDDLGITLTSKTGWSGSTTIVYKFTKALSVCGYESWPGEGYSPHRVYVK